MSAQNASGMADSEKINTNIVTLTRFLNEEQAKHKDATGDFTYVPPLPITTAHHHSLPLTADHGLPSCSC